ncbi:MAG: hypothetical protein JHC87_04820, partial [Thermoleophilaceae bacterium]|nr:hypothetical protein [Thermoleophilaceae bacterium]
GNLANDPKYSLNPVRRDVRWKHPGDTKGGGAVARLKRLVKLVLFRIDRVSLRRQRAIDASTTSIERQLAAAKAESLSEFRRLRSELGDLRRQVAAAELALSTSASAPTSVEMPADAQNIDQQPPTNGGDPQASQPAPSADTA